MTYAPDLMTRTSLNMNRQNAIGTNVPNAKPRTLDAEAELTMSLIYGRQRRRNANVLSQHLSREMIEELLYKTAPCYRGAPCTKKNCPYWHSEARDGKIRPVPCFRHVSGKCTRGKTCSRVHIDRSTIESRMTSQEEWPALPSSNGIHIMFVPEPTTVSTVASKPTITDAPSTDTLLPADTVPQYSDSLAEITDLFRQLGDILKTQRSLIDEMKPLHWMPDCLDASL